MDEITVELPFPAGYDVRVREELPGGGRLDHMFARDERVRDGGVLIEVIGAGGDWIGLVANAPASVSRALSGVYSTPSPSVFCVVARGDAYLIDADAPDRWWVLEDSPVVAVRCAVAQGLLVFATSWRVVAVGEPGVAWRTSRIAIDGIALGGVVGGELGGVADPEDEDAQDFVVELGTGHHRGGFPFAG